MAMLLRLQTRRDYLSRPPLAAAEEEKKTAGGGGTISMREAARLYGRDPKLLLLVASEAMLLAVMDTSAVLPLYLHTELGADFDEAARVASLFPLGMVIATFGGGFM
jgi:hypothetical protein